MILLIDKPGEGVLSAFLFGVGVDAVLGVGRMAIVLADAPVVMHVLLFSLDFEVAVLLVALAFAVHDGVDL